MGYLAFHILIPVSCAFLGIYLFIKKDVLKIWALKLIVFAIVLVTIIPLSLKISDLIYEVNKSAIEQVTTAVEESVPEEEKAEDKGWLEGMLDSITTGIVNVKEKAQEILNKFIDAIAIFIITYCVIPIAVVLIMVWLVKFLFGIILVNESGVKKIGSFRKSFRWGAEEEKQEDE